MQDLPSASQNVTQTALTDNDGGFTISGIGPGAFTGSITKGGYTPRTLSGTIPKSVVINLDKTAPTISCSASPSLLWPANHKMITITVSVNVSDSRSGTAGFKLVSVTSNEPDNGLGDGDTPNDIQGWAIGTADTTGQLRAERSGQGAGRQYTLTYVADDVAGNHTTCVTTVIVPHDRGK